MYLFLTVLGAGKSKIKAPADSFSGRGWGIHFLLCPHKVKGARELPGVPLIRALIPFMRASSSLPNHLSKAPPFHESVRISTLLLKNVDVMSFQQLH